MAVTFADLVTRRWQVLRAPTVGQTDAGGSRHPAELGRTLARVAATGSTLADAERAHELTRLDLDRLAGGLGRPLQVWEPRRYALVLAAAGTIAGLATARIIAPALHATPSTALLVGTVLAVQLVSALHVAGRRLRQFSRTMRRDGKLEVAGMAGLSLAHALAVAALPLALGFAQGLAAPMLACLAATAALSIAAFLRHDPDPELEAADRTLRAAEARLTAARADHDMAVAAARTAFEIQLAAPTSDITIDSAR